MNVEERRRLIAERKEGTERKVRIWCKDTWRDFQVFRVPVEALLLNADNRRFAAERQLHEERLGHSLDPENNPDDEQSIISILLDSNQQVDGGRVRGTPSKNYEALKTDWLKRKQETPFWIRPEGRVRNGNRRLAVIHRLRAEVGIEGNDWVDVIILEPSDINEDDLFEMEQREQLTENLKVRYTDINLLLALRDAALAKDIDWADQDSIERVASELQHAAGGDKAYALIQLYAIKYMDAYLADSGQPGQYQKLLRQVERFRDVGKNMARMEADYAAEAPDMMRLAFAAIRAGNRHGDIRSLRKMFLEDRSRYNALLKAIEKDEQEWEKAPNTQLANPVVAAVDTDDDEDTESADPPGPLVPEYPVERVNERIKNAIDGFQSATGLKVQSALYQIWSRLETLDRSKLQDALADDPDSEIRTLLTQIIAWSKKAEADLKK